MTNPSYEYMRRIRREERDKLLDMRRERAVKALRSLDLHGGSHAMLSQIAYAIHPHAGAWDVESCDHVRNVLVELIGGDHEAVSGNQRHCACGVGGCDRGDESEEVRDTSVTSELREYVRTHETTTMVYATMPPQVEDKPTSNGEKLIAIADRIDEQFERSSERHEVVLQDANNIQLLVECLKPAIADNDKRVVELEAERDDLLDMLRDARDEYKMLDRMSAETSVNFHTMRDRVWGLEAERDELQGTIADLNEQLERRKAKCLRYKTHIDQMQGGSKRLRKELREQEGMYLDLLRDAARDYKAMQNKLNLVFDMWVNATITKGTHE